VYAANANPVDALDHDWSDDLRNGIWPRSVPLWLTAFWLALFVIRPWEVMFPALASYHVERIYAIAVIAAVVTSGQLRLRGSFQTTAVLLFLVALVVTSLCAVYRCRWDRLYEYLTLVIFYFVLLSVVRTPYQLLFLVVCYLVAMAAYLGKSEWEYFVHGRHHYTMGVTRLLGIDRTFGDPNSVATSTVLTLPFLHCLWQSRKELTRTWPVIWQTWFPRCLVAYFALALTSIVLTNSRAGMLGCVLFVLLSAVCGDRRSGRLASLVVAGLFLAVVWVTMPTEHKNRLRTVWNPEVGPANAQASAEGRIEGLKAGVEMFRRFPVTGVGLYNFQAYRAARVDGSSASAHNLIGEMLGETGIVGTGAFLLLVAGVFLNCHRTHVLAKGQSQPTLEMLSRLATACQFTMILLGFAGLFGHNLLRFNWLWVAAFALLGRVFAEDLRAACVASVGTGKSRPLG